MENITISKNVDSYVDFRLKAWARWSEKNLVGALGYPSSSAFTRINSHSPIPHSSRVPEGVNDEEAECVDRAINELAKYKEHLARIITINYTGTGSIKEKIKKIGISYDGFKKQLALARAWISGMILR